MNMFLSLTGDHAFSWDEPRWDEPGRPAGGYPPCQSAAGSLVILLFRARIWKISAYGKQINRATLSDVG